LNNLGVEYIDVVLIHSPIRKNIIGVWEKLVKFKNDGIIRKIGVSNFGTHQIIDFIDYCIQNDLPKPEINFVNKITLKYMVGVH
jgi:diketogulonate reductase-like aldo/keto reductase